MKKFYVSPAVEVTAFIAEDIVCASTVSFDGGNTTYDVVSQGIGVVNNEQRVTGTTQAPYSFGD